MFEEFAHFFQEAYPSELRKATDTRNDMIKSGEMTTMKKIARDFIRPNGGVSLPSLNYERYKKYPDRHDENWRYCEKYPEKDYNMTYKYVEQQMKKFTDRDKIYSIQQLRSAKKNLFDLLGIGHPDEKVLVVFRPSSLGVSFKIINVRQHKLFKPSKNIRFIHFSPQSSLTSLSPTICSRDFGSVKHTYVYPTLRCYFWAIDMDKVPESALSYAYDVYGNNVYEYIPKPTDRIVIDESDNTRYPGATPVFIETDSSLSVKPVTGEIRNMKRAFEKRVIKWRDPYMKNDEKPTPPNQRVKLKCDILEDDFKSKQTQYSRMKDMANGKIDKLKMIFDKIKSYIDEIPSMVDSSKADAKEKCPEATNLGDFDKLGKKYLRKAKELLKEVAALLKRQGVVVEYAFDDDDTSGTSDFDTHIDNDPDDCYCEESIPTSGDFAQYAQYADLDAARGPITNIHMRPATEADAENMYNWEIESIHPELRIKPDVQELIRKDVQQSIKDTQMIMDGDKTIGMFTACMIDDGEWRYIGEIYLIPEYRGRGIGTSILKNEIDNFDKIRLQVATTNTQAIKLYESLGFKIVKEVDGQMYIMEYDTTKETVQEAKLPAKKRNKLDDSDFALVYVDAYGDKIRKYPINDEAHVRAAARMFPRGVPLKYRSEVAGKILHRAHKFGIDTSGWNSVNAAHKK